MHAFPIKPRVIVVRSDQDKHTGDAHAVHLSPRHSPGLLHPRASPAGGDSPTKSPAASPIAAHRVKVSEHDAEDAPLASHPLPQEPEVPSHRL